MAMIMSLFLPMAMSMSMTMPLMPVSMAVSMSMPMPPKNNTTPKLLHPEIPARTSLLKDTPYPLLRKPVMHNRMRSRQRVIHLLVRQEIENDENPARPQPLHQPAGRELRVLKVVEPETDTGNVKVAEAAVVGSERRGGRVGRVREVALVGVHFVGGEALRGVWVVMSVTGFS
ncbi:hypothetical protein CCUS01_12408 [Colletotrichum cuscutae]|uniref:Uncharacterized protein n=1 Tax=Colletotrichum cuscutae TaxID=1209917 RepID=A0AAI9TXN0_9PEZI|nr:hypothetical protein CCUS01_12408 [Colletotrichum cuscutae]